MNALLAAWKNSGTKIIGIAQGTVAALAGIAGLIPENHLKYWLAASAVLTVWRGFGNTAAITTDTHDDGTAGEST